jgi:hypothetical protein
MLRSPTLKQLQKRKTKIMFDSTSRTIQNASYLGINFRCFAAEEIVYILTKDAEKLLSKSISTDICTPLKDIAGIEAIDTASASLSGNVLALPVVNLIEIILGSNHSRVANLVSLLVELMPSSEDSFALYSERFSITFTPKR